MDALVCASETLPCPGGSQARAPAANVSGARTVQDDAINSVFADLRYAGRELRRRPGFAITAVPSTTAVSN
jgi:hypothetical protein